MKVPKLSLRDLFWLVALVAVVCAWLVDRTADISQRERELSSLEEELKEREELQDRSDDQLNLLLMHLGAKYPDDMEQVMRELGELLKTKKTTRPKGFEPRRAVP